MLRRRRVSTTLLVAYFFQVLDEFRKFTTLVHLKDNVTPTNKLPFYVQLRDRRPFTANEETS